MNVLVDTPIWSLALRRKTGQEAETTFELAALLDEGRVAIMGPIRQEILSGIREDAQFDRLRQQLRSFPDTAITSRDHEEAARFYNVCRKRGIQGSNTEFLICAVASRNKFSIFTTDQDFAHYSNVLPVVLHEMR